MPFHIWLPAAHANAPSHVSALMSGVMLKMGIYGILRVLSFFHGQLLWWGALLTVVGIGSALLGVTFAMAQRDVKRLLACSSIENIGIITTGLGLGFMGQATGNTALAFLGMAGGLFHLLNHSIFKPLLFLGSGAIIHGAGTRLMDRMGGLGKRMPHTALFFLIGSLAICGLPPLNGFASEFILYLALFRQLTAPGLTFLVFLVPVLALVGGLAVIAFVKLYGSVFLGNPRSGSAAHGHEPGILMQVPMALLAGAAVLAGMFPQAVLRIVEPVVAACFPGQEGKGISVAAAVATVTAPLSWLTLCGLGLLAFGCMITLFYRYRRTHSPGSITTTWGCGYLQPTSRMQYTATSFSEMAVDIFGGLVRQKIDRPTLDTIFPRPCRLADRPTETILDRLIVPFFTVAGLSCSYLRRLQHGELQVYMLYIFATLFVLMTCGHW
jgi:hydrogenase-4 component B